MSQLKIDKNSPEPIYMQLYKQLLEKIYEGVYPDGTYLPSSVWLAKEYDIAIVVIRKAFHMLVEDGIVRRSGKGMKVSLKTANAMAIEAEKNELQFHIKKAFLLGMEKEQIAELLDKAFLEE